MNRFLIAALQVIIANDQPVKKLKFLSQPRKEDIQAALDFWSNLKGPHYDETDLDHYWTKDENIKEQETVQPGGAWDADEQYDEYGEPIEEDEDDDGFLFYKKFDIEQGAFKDLDLPTLLEKLDEYWEYEDRDYSYLTKYYKNGVLTVPPIIQLEGMVADGFGRIFLAWALGLNKVKVVNYHVS